MANTTRPRSADAASNGSGPPDVAVSGLAATVSRTRRTGPIWPFGVIPALATAGAVLVVLLAIVVVLGVVAHWPDQRYRHSCPPSGLPAAATSAQRYKM